MHAKIQDYIEIIEKVARVEHKRIPSHMVDYDELVSIGIIALQVMIKDKTEEQLARYNNAYISTAVRWAIRNELRNRYKWYIYLIFKRFMLNQTNTRNNRYGRNKFKNRRKAKI